MRKLLFILFTISVGYSQEIVRTNFPKDTSVEFSEKTIIVRTDGKPDMIFNVLKDDKQGSFEIYETSGNFKITHIKNFPEKSKCFIVFDFQDNSNKSQTVIFSYISNKKNPL